MGLARISVDFDPVVALSIDLTFRKNAPPLSPA